MRLDTFLPRYDVAMRHSVCVQASVERTYRALLAADLSTSRIVGLLLWLRGLARSRRQRAPDTDFVERTRRHGFLVLAHEPQQEVVFGVVGKFWLPTGGRASAPSREDFVSFAQQGFAKAVWNIRLASAGPDSTLVATETRVQCLGAAARRRFRAYWTLVRPFSGLIRILLLRQIKRRAEARG